MGSIKADKDKEKKRLQDSVDDIVRRQREEQLKLMELQAQTAQKKYEEDALTAAQSDENSHHHDHVSYPHTPPPTQPDAKMPEGQAEQQATCIQLLLLFYLFCLNNSPQPIEILHQKP